MQANTTAEQLTKDFQLTLSKLGHEIRNPIALISSQLQLMASSHPELCGGSQWDNLMDNLEYVKELLNELSDYNNAGRISLTPVNPGKFLQSILSCEKITLDYLGITLETEIQDVCSQILLDRVKMRQALFNLLRNARESIEPPGGKITVRLQKDGDGICISIRDNGCGMTRQQLQRAFSPFVTYKSEGTGLGLAVASQIITAHGGRLEADSRPGHGSIFQIFLG